MICLGNKFTDAADAGSPGTRPQRSTGTALYNSGGGAFAICVLPRPPGDSGALSSSRTTGTEVKTMRGQTPIQILTAPLTSQMTRFSDKPEKVCDSGFLSLFL